MQPNELCFACAPLALAITAAIAFTLSPLSAQAQSFPANIPLSGLNGSNGFRLDGVDAYDASGISVSSAGDFNGDGTDDLIIGARYGSYGGAAYIIFGRSNGFAAAQSLSALNGNDGFVLEGANLSDDAGATVGNAGDINGDGIDDVIIGAPGVQSNAGGAYVVFGRTTGFPSIVQLDALDGSDGFQVVGAAAQDLVGNAVAGVGDINGDGIDDLMVASSGLSNGGLYSGSSYVVFGHTGSFPASRSLASLDGSDGFRLDGVTADRSGESIAAAGDVNGDGIGDLIIGAPNGSNGGTGVTGTQQGNAYVVFGQTSAFPPTMSLGALNGVTGFRIDGVSNYDYAGKSVSSAGDTNGDGIDDLLVGAFWTDHGGSNSGSAYVVYGQTQAFPATLALSTLDGSTGFRLDGVADFDETGRATNAGGDLNGDGIGDVVIGALNANNGGNGRGSTYVVFGLGGSRPATQSLSALDGNNGFRLDGAGNDDRSGSAVNAAGDINADGLDDLVIGAHRADNGANLSGSSYVVFGRRGDQIFSNGFE